MKNFHLVSFSLIVLVLLSLSVAAIAQEGRATFRVLDRDMSVIELSKRTAESGSVFRDRSGDGLYDTLYIRDMELTCEIDEPNAYGVTYTDGPRVAFYPSADGNLPEAGEVKLFGFLHYFTKEGQSVYFAVVVSRLTAAEEESMRKNRKKGQSLLPYQVDFVESNGLRVGVPTFLIIPHSRLIYNADFQKFNRSTDTILLGTNPAAPNREIYIFRKIPTQEDNLLLIHYRWY